MKKLSVIFICIFLLLLIDSPFAENLIINSSFESGNQNKINDWLFFQYNPDASTAFVEKGPAQDGQQYVMITSNKKNDARLYQLVPVEGGQKYHVSAWVKTKNVGKGIAGANINIIDHLAVSGDVQGDQLEWSKLDLYFQPEEDVFTVKLALGLGWYGAENTGTAYFDNISMEKIDNAPANQALHQIPNLNKPKPQGQSEGIFNIDPQKFILNLGDSMQEIVFIFLLLFSVGGYILFLFFFDKEKLYSYPEAALNKLKAFITPPDLHKNGFFKGVIFSNWFKALVFIILALVFWGDLQLALKTDPIAGAENHYVYQAQAILEGRIDVGRYLHDTAEMNGKIYVIYPPFPLLLVMPFVAIWGLKTKLTLIGIYITIIAAFLLVRILQKLKISNKNIPWVLAAFFLGTGYFLCLRNSLGVAWFAHIVAVFAVIVMMYFALVKGNALLTGLFLGFAFLSRQLSIWMSIFAFFALWQYEPQEALKKRIFKILSFGISFVFCVAIYLFYNYVRFGDPFDTGYSYLRLGGFMATRANTYGQFSIHHIPFNFVYMFLQGFHINYGDWPDWANSWHEYWALDPFGTSITFASPFVFFAFWGKMKDKWIHWAAWASIVGSLVHQLMYYNNGWVQYNTQRFSLDFLPLLMLFVALGFEKNDGKYWKPLIMVALGLNAITFLLIAPPG